MSDVPIIARYRELEPLPLRDRYPLGKPAGVDPSAMVVVAAVIAAGEAIVAELRELGDLLARAGAE